MCVLVLTAVLHKLQMSSVFISMTPVEEVSPRDRTKFLLRFLTTAFELNFEYQWCYLYNINSCILYIDIQIM